MQPLGNTILITGGGSGIGGALAAEFHRAGNKVIVAGRRQAQLEETIAAHPGMAARHLDLTDAAGIADFAIRVTAEFPDLNVVVHSAGIMIAEDKIDLPVAESTITTNLLGPIRLTSALLPQLLAQARATVMTVSSGLAFVPKVATPTYCATKAAIHSWSLSLRQQLHGTGVEVVELIPPAVQTDLMPGMKTNPTMMPLDAFAAEVMALLSQQPTPEEICVERVRFLRDALGPELFIKAFRAINQPGLE